MQSVSKSFGNKPVLESINLTVLTGQSHVLLGSSGSGKSTLLKIAMGLMPSNGGTITLDEEHLNYANVDARTKWKHRLGYVPQDGGLFPHLTAEQNVSLVAQTLRWPDMEIRKRLFELFEIFSLKPELMARYPHELSGGQRQRVAVMRAVFLDPKVILLDEPLGALDPIVRADVQSKLREIFERLQKTVLLVTHDIAEAVFLGNMLTLLKDGRVLQTGRIAEFVSSPRDPYVTQFINAQRSWEHL